MPSQVRRRADARRGVIQSGGTGLRERDQIPNARHRQRRMADQQIGRRSDEHDGGEISEDVIGKLPAESGTDRHGSRSAQQQRVAIGQRPRRKLGADDATGTAAVVGHDLLPELVAQMAGHDASNQIVPPARWKRHDQADRPGRIGVGRARRIRRRQQCLAQGCGRPCTRVARDTPPHGLPKLRPAGGISRSATCPEPGASRASGSRRPVPRNDP
jgi:hypothetical protein